LADAMHTALLDNLTERMDLASIRNEGKIYSACGDGKIPFIRWDLPFSAVVPSHPPWS
jgi:hypothetical protein